MATDLSSPPRPMPGARTHARRAWLLLALGVFQLWLWITRIVNLVRDGGEFTAAFIAVHTVLYTAAIGAGVVLLVLGWRMWCEARGASAAGDPMAPRGRGDGA